MHTFTPPLPGKTRAPTIIETTLYDLIEAIQAMMPPGGEALVVPTVIHLLDTSHVTFSRRSASDN